MNNLEFLDWKGDEQTFDFIGWASGRVANAFLDSAAFVLDEKGQRKILQLRLPFLKPATYQRDPFPPHPPTRIEKFRLRPPPCRPSKGEAEDLLAFAQGGRPAVKSAGGHFTSPETWEVIYGEVLNPRPEDDAELRERMEKQKEEHRREYESRKRDLAGRTDEAAAREAATLEEIYNAPLRRLRKDGPLVAGHLNVSLDLVKQGGALLTQYMHEWWALRNGFNLREMSQDAKAFLRQWVELTTEIVESNPTQGGGRITTKVQNWAGWHDKEQELLAQVACRIHFADGRRFWLSGCKIRDLQTPEEAREFGELLAAHQAAREDLSALKNLASVVGTELKGAICGPALPSPRYLLRRGVGVWRVVFDWKEGEIDHVRGISLVAYLLFNPPSGGLHGTELAKLAFGQEILQEATLCSDGDSTRQLIEKEAKECMAVLKNPGSSETEKAEAMEHLNQLAKTLNVTRAASESGANKQVRALRRAIKRLIDNLCEAKDRKNDPHMALRAFGEHLYKHLWIPSSRFSRNPRSRARAGVAGQFTYEPPDGVVWEE